MKHDGHCSHTNNDLLMHVLYLPKKIVLLHGQNDHENISEFVLHDFCDENCFDLSKVAFFVDNPDFNCFKGVAGVCKYEQDYCKDIYNVWQEPEKYRSCMQKSPFNAQVRDINHASISNYKDEKDTLISFAQSLGFANYDYCKWPLKHGNNGYLVFEKNPKKEEVLKQYLSDFVYVLSLCPIC
jgi:phage/plasmid-associated DNA primase